MRHITRQREGVIGNYSGIVSKYAHDLKHRELMNRVIESEEVLQVTENLLHQPDRVRVGHHHSRRKVQIDMRLDLAAVENNGKAIRCVKIALKLLQCNRPIGEITEDMRPTCEEVEDFCKKSNFGD